jgi:hypothetical protein
MFCNVQKMYCKAVGISQRGFRFEVKVLSFVNPKDSFGKGCIKYACTRDGTTFLTPAAAMHKLCRQAMITSSKETVTIL